MEALAWVLCAHWGIRGNLSPSIQSAGHAGAPGALGRGWSSAVLGLSAYLSVCPKAGGRLGVTVAAPMSQLCIGHPRGLTHRPP